MLNIFKYFFGIILIIGLIYFIIVMFNNLANFVPSVSQSANTTIEKTTEVVKDAGSNLTKNETNATPTQFPLVNWLLSIHPFTSTLNYAPSYAPSGVVKNLENSGGFFTNISKSKDLQFQDVNNQNNNISLFNFNSKNSHNTGVQNKNEAQVAEYIFPDLQNGAVLDDGQVIFGYAFHKVFLNGYFPVYILDRRGNVIGKFKAFSNGDINPDGFVPFRGVASFRKNIHMILSNESGFLLFKNENQNISNIQTSKLVPVRF